MEELAFWAFLFAAATAVLFLLEIFIPSGGLLGGLSALSAIAMLWCLFLIDSSYGVVGIIALMILAPIGIVAGLQVFPRTPIGRMMILQDEQATETEAHGDTTPDPEAELVGKRGRTLGRLNPGGVVKIDGRRVHCTADRGLIESGEAVEVIRVSGMEVRVRQVG